MTRVLLIVAVSVLGLNLQGTAEAKKPKNPPAQPAPAAEAPLQPATPTDADPPPPAPPAPAPTPPPEATTPPRGTNGDWLDPTEKAATRLVFIGGRYRATIVPKFLLNLFVDEGRTVVSHSAGLEFDIRHDHFSVIPNITYTEYGLSDTLFLQKNKAAGVAGNYSFVGSNLKGIFIGTDVLWSSHVHANIDIEYGLGVGVGVILGDLVNNWVYADGQGPLVNSTGQHFSGCRTVADGSGCNPTDHSNADTAKVNRYVEPNWFNGGPTPTLFARIAPTFGLRFKPMRDMEARLQFGVSLTEGFFVGFSANYRLPYEGAVK